VLVNAETETYSAYDRKELIGQAVESLVPGNFERNIHNIAKDTRRIPGRGLMGEGLGCAGCERTQPIPRRDQPKPAGSPEAFE